ncbi:MAG TPA: hypothetical protein PK280_06800 [Planctomycetota bacterium]|nr:hypothetical protein [Planctomycetota bacterium]
MRAAPCLAATCLTTVLLAAALLPAAAGEEAARKAAPPLDDGLARRLPAAFGRADLIALVKVTELGDAKPPGEGLEGDEAQLAQIFGVPNMWDKIKKRQVAVEVEEVLKGERDVRDLKTVKFRVFTSLATGKELALVVADAAEMSRTTSFKAHYRKPSFPLTLAKGGRAIVFLRAADKPAAEGKPAEKVWSPAGPLMGPEAERLTAAVREIQKQVTEWEKLPRLQAEETEAVRKLVGELVSEDFPTRAAAAKGLAAKGCADKPLVEVAMVEAPDLKAEDRVDRIAAAARLASAVRDQLRQMAEWDSPPKLSSDDEAAARKLFAELGSADFRAREAATKALAAKGRAVRALLEAGIKSGGDPEAKSRAELILEELRPPALRLELVAGLLATPATE